MHWFSQILFWNETQHVSDSFSVHRKKFLTVHTTVVYVIQVYRHLYDIYHCCVYGEKLLMMDRGTVQNM
jgi:hypothetical protein